MADRTIEIGIEYKLDKSKSQQAIRETDHLEEALEDVERAAKKVARAQDQANDAANQAARAQQQAATAQARATTARTGAGDFASRATALGGLASNFGAGQEFMFAADFLDAAEAAGQLREGVTTMGRSLLKTGPLTTGLVGSLDKLGVASAGGVVAIGAVTAVVAALAVAAVVMKDTLGELTKANEEAQQAMNARIDAIQRYNEFIATATTEEMQAEYEAARQRQQIAMQTQEDLLELRSAFEHGLDTGDNASVIETLSEGALRLYDALGGNLAGIDDLNTAIDESTVAVQKEQAYMDLLTQAFVEGVGATNDAAAAQAALHEQQVQAVQAQADLNRRALEWTGEQAQARLRSIEIERQSLESMQQSYEDLTAAGGDFTAETQAVRDQLSALETEETALTDTIIPAITAREAEADAIKKQQEYTEALIESMRADTQAKAEAIAKERERQQEAEADAVELTRKFESERLAAESEYQAARTDDLKEFAREQAETELDYYNQRAANTASFAQKQREDIDSFNEQQTADDEKFKAEQLKREKDFQKEQARAAEDHRYNLLDAAAKLDALGVIQELRSYNTQQKRAKEDFSDSQQEQQQQFDEQRAAAEKAFYQRLTDEKRAFDRQQAQADAAFRLQEQRQRDSFNRELAQADAAFRQAEGKRNADYRSQLTALGGESMSKQTHYNNMLTLQSQYQARELDAQRQHYNNMVAVVSKSGGGSGKGSDSRGLRSYDIGGYTINGPIRTRQGEFVLDPTTTRMAEGVMGSLTQGKIRGAVNSNNDNSRSVSVGDIHIGDVGSYTPTAIKRIVYSAIEELVQS